MGLSRKDLVESLRRAGVREGDVLYIRASLGALGRIDGDIFDVVIGGLREAVGPSGTILAPAFNKISNIFSRRREVIDLKSTPISGAVSKLLLRDPESQRSNHPSHSFVAVGPHARALLEGHEASSSCFLPIKKLAEIDGKMILLGCTSESPGFSTVHVAQFELGLSRRHFIRFFQRSFIKPLSKIECWRPIESPGCSLSFGKFYQLYIEQKNLLSGYIGSAYFLMVPSSREALAAEMRVLKKSPTFVDCGRYYCLTCGFRGYQLWKIPMMLVAVLYHRLLKGSNEKI